MERAIIRRWGWQCLPVLLILLTWVILFEPGSLFASQSEKLPQKTFISPEDAVRALVSAVRRHDMKELSAIFGPGSEELLSSGDDIADAVDREIFLKAYEEMHTIKPLSGEYMALSIGRDDWPLPIPIVKTGEFWSFDMQKGKQEILNRRIGRNELHALGVVHAYVEAQHEYASKDCRGQGKVEFAQRLISTEGKRDGLYWEPLGDEDESPLGPLVARASKEGYPNADFSPFHGYYFKILKEQGKHAEGGAYRYVVQDRMILGFALVAYPADYGNSGIMTFMVNQNGIIYQKDLGKETRPVAESMHAYDPDATWKKVAGGMVP